MRVTVRLFAGAREAVGTGARDVELADTARVTDVLQILETAHPRLIAYRGHLLLAVNGTPATGAARLRDGDVVALMPPVSGGAQPATVDGSPFSLDDLVAATPAHGAGAVVAFTGIVRATSGASAQARVARLDIEAYAEMAEAELARVRQEAIAKFGLAGCTLRHRTGALTVGDPIVAVVVTAPHRREAFAAAAWIMDELKATVPVWKRETDEDGTTRWVNDPATEETP